MRQGLPLLHLGVSVMRLLCLQVLLPFVVSTGDELPWCQLPLTCNPGSTSSCGARAGGQGKELSASLGGPTLSILYGRRCLVLKASEDLLDPAPSSKVSLPREKLRSSLRAPSALTSWNGGIDRVCFGRGGFRSAGGRGGYCRRWEGLWRRDGRGGCHPGRGKWLLPIGLRDPAEFQSRSSDVVWIRATDAGVLAAFLGKALHGRRISQAGPLLARAGGDGVGCPRYEEDEADTETAMKVDYALLTRGAMDSSMALELAERDPNFLRFTDRHGTTVWPTRDSLLSGSASADFQMASSSPTPVRAKAAARAPAAPLPRPPLRPQAPANGATPKFRAAPERAPSFGAGLDKEAMDSGFSPEDLAALAQIPQGEKMKNGSEKTRYVPETALVEVAEEEEDTLKESQSPSVAGALMKLSEVLAAIPGVRRIHRSKTL
ncbi:unnamed protein product [Polarella glacialis]|uniref:Uncharacterized protein n=1 Tax=Polarella glacialis TaxID=89957 RepID=A0A813JT06_POLGL|nr:unnamed protein product [Polarella glacialis]